MTISFHLGEESHRKIQRMVNPASLSISVYGLKIPNSKFKTYADGTAVPSAKLVAEVELHVKGSADILNLVLWRVLRSHGSIENNAKAWMYELVALTSLGLVFTPDHKIALKGDHHFLPALERRAGFEALTALTIIFKLNLEAGDTEQAWNVAHSIFRVLLLMGGELLDLDIAQPLFELYVDRIFSQVTFDGKVFDFAGYKFEVIAAVFESIAQDLQVKLANARDRRMRSYYGLQILDGRHYIDFRESFRPKIKEIESAT